MRVMPHPEDDDGNDDPTEPLVPPPAAPDKPPLLDYPGPVSEGEFGETESWSQVARALLVVFGVLGLMFLITFGLCGVFAHGCG
jgi:hypothetical protein